MPFPDPMVPRHRRGARGAIAVCAPRTNKRLLYKSPCEAAPAHHREFGSLSLPLRRSRSSDAGRASRLSDCRPSFRDVNWLRAHSIHASCNQHGQRYSTGHPHTEVDWLPWIILMKRHGHLLERMERPRRLLDATPKAAVTEQYEDHGLNRAPQK